MPQISFQYPVWFLLLCAVLATGYAMLLYYRDNSFREQSANLNRWLGILRWLSIFLISALLLSPLLKSVLTETKKPVVVMAQDQSESVGLAMEKENMDQYKQQWAEVKEKLSAQYEVHELAFGDNVRESVDFKFEDKVTNFSQLLQSVYDLYGAQNLGAVIVSSDGVYNEGSNPAYSGAQIAAPIYTVALGDTTPKKDLLLKRVFHNKIAYLGDKFSIQIDVAATNMAGNQTVLTVSETDGSETKTLQSLPITIGKNDFFTTKEVLLEAKKAGVSRYVVSVSKLPGEASGANNSKEIFVDVLDARQKILLLANSPHPDLNALLQMLEGNKNYQAQIAYPNQPGLDVSKYDFVVLHNLPSTTNDISGILNTLNTHKIPRLFIAGLQANQTAVGKAQPLVNIQSDGRQADDVQGKVSAQFAAFTIDPKVVEELPKFNPVISPFGNYDASPQAQVVLWKRIGKVDTRQPLLAIGETNGAKTGIFLGEGLWKWRLFDYMQHNNHDIFNEIIGKTVQYLSVKEDKRKFRVTIDKNIFNENEPVTFGAELYNDNYELINDPDVALQVRNKEGKEYTFTFNKVGKAYEVNAGILPVGNYTYKATTPFNGQTLAFEGVFSVRPIQIELFETVANHAALAGLSQKYGGEMVYPGALTSLVDKIQNRDTIKPVIYQTTKTRSIINLRWIFALLAGLLALEWFARRYFGAY